MANGEASQGREVQDAGRRPFRILLAALVLVLALVTASFLVERKRPPEPAEAEIAAHSEPTSEAGAGKIQGRGTVAPKVEVDIMSEVAGKVIFIHSGVKAGGLIRAGERIVQIDPRDCELAVRQARAAVAEAQARLDGVAAEADMVRRDWRVSNPEVDPDAPLLFREPQIQQARASLESAKAGLAMAELQLERTSISLPFDVLIAAKRVDLGQYVTVGQPLAKAYGIDAFEVEVPLTNEDLAGFDALETIFPAGTDVRETQRLSVDVKMTLAGRECVWQGYVLHATGRMDGGSGQIPVVVEIPRPLETSDDRPPLLPGACVQVFITGGTPESAAERVAQ
jgi:RND family efflux transporter MFP subunit